ncbi:MAG: hypothetical protein ACRBBZ_03435 [Nitrosopumilus sp.]
MMTTITILGGAFEVNTGSSGICESSTMIFGEVCSGGSYPESGTPYGQTISFL